MKEQYSEHLHILVQFGYYFQHHPKPMCYRLDIQNLMIMVNGSMLIVNGLEIET